MPVRLKPKADKRGTPVVPLLLAGGFVAGAAIGTVLPDGAIDPVIDGARIAADAAGDQLAALGLKPGCNIKGNISINSGERIYHVPGQEYYIATRISPEYGERWFCTEEEARAAGWRRARQ